MFLTLPQIQKLFFTISFLTLSGLVLFSRASSSQAEISSMDTGALLEASILISVDGGANSLGKKTSLINGSINFGTVSFIDTGSISNGDSYLHEGQLRLEAILVPNITFGGANGVTLSVAKRPISTNPFKQTYYSLSTDRTAPLYEIYSEPRSNNLQTLSQSGSFNLRIVCEIAPNLKGRISDTFLLTAVTE